MVGMTQVCFLLLSAFSLYSVFKWPYLNGFFHLLHSHASGADFNVADRWLPTDIVGIATLNWLCRDILAFFHISLSGRSPVLGLYSLYSAGTQGSLWMILMLEFLKEGHMKPLRSR